MTATYTTYGRTQIQAALLTPDVYIPPSQLWLALSLVLLQSNATVDLLDEPDPDDGYHRLSVPTGSAYWTPSGFGEFSNNTATSDSITMTSDSGLVLGWALVDSETIGEGNLWAIGTLQSPIVLTVSSSPFTADDFTLGLYD